MSLSSQTTLHCKHDNYRRVIIFLKRNVETAILPLFPHNRSKKIHIMNTK